MKLTGVPDIMCHVLTSLVQALLLPNKKNKSPSLHQQTVRSQMAALITHWDGIYVKAFELCRI